MCLPAVVAPAHQSCFGFTMWFAEKLSISVAGAAVPQWYSCPPPALPVAGLAPLSSEHAVQKQYKSAQARLVHNNSCGCHSAGSCPATGHEHTPLTLLQLCTSLLDQRGHSHRPTLHLGLSSSDDPGRTSVPTAYAAYAKRAARFCGFPRQTAGRRYPGATVGCRKRVSGQPSCDGARCPAAGHQWPAVDSRCQHQCGSSDRSDCSAGPSQRRPTAAGDAQCPRQGASPSG